MRTIISTVGKSLLGNASRKLQDNNLDIKKLTNFLRHGDDIKSSAESNSLSRLTENGDKLIFLHSSTEEGRLCAKSLVSYYANKGFETEEIEIEDLDYEESQFKMRGLRFLVENIIEIIENERGKNRKVLINATGGFKAEIAYATMIGLLLKVPVYYIHEVFNDIIEMPPSPINWDFSFIAEFEDFFNWINKDLRKTDEVDNKLNDIKNKLKSNYTLKNKGVNDIRMLLAEEEGYTMLSPTGQTYFKSYKSYLYSAEKTDLLISDKARKQLKSLEPAITSEFKNIFKKLTVRELWSASAAHKKGDCLVYPQGHKNERIFLYDNSVDNEIYICELTRHSDDSYENMLESGVWFEDYNNFSELSPKEIWSENN